VGRAGESARAAVHGVARGKVRDLCAHRLDSPGHVAVQHGGLRRTQGGCVAPSDLVVDGIYARGVDPEEHLVGIDLGHGLLSLFEDLRTSEVVEDPGVHGRGSGYSC